MPTGLGDEQLWLCPSLSGQNTTDLSGNGNLTAVQGNISFTANSGEGGSLCFEGDGSTGSNGLKLDSPSSADLPASATYTMWVQAHDLSGTSYFVAGRSTSSQNMFDLAIKSSNLRCRINNGGITLFQQSGLLTVNTWHHVSLTRSTNNWELFVDGVSSATGSGTLNSYTQDFTTWMQNTVGSSTLDGYMDDIRVYDRTLTQAEITHLATSRGVLGPPGGATHYNPFKTHAFTNNFQQRLR